jgi:hypothetical protein
MPPLARSVPDAHRFARVVRLAHTIDPFARVIVVFDRCTHIAQADVAAGRLIHR